MYTKWTFSAASRIYIYDACQVQARTHTRRGGRQHEPTSATYNSTRARARKRARICKDGSKHNGEARARQLRRKISRQAFNHSRRLRGGGRGGGNGCGSTARAKAGKQRSRLRRAGQEMMTFCIQNGHFLLLRVYIYTMHVRCRRGRIQEGVAGSTNQRARRITVHARARAQTCAYMQRRLQAQWRSTRAPVAAQILAASI